MKTFAFAIAAVIAASSSAAVAQPVAASRTVHVSFADLDLSQAAGRAALEHRVSHAVMRVCPLPYGGDTRAMSAHRVCRVAAWSGARKQLAAVYGETRYAGVPPHAVAAN